MQIGLTIVEQAWALWAICRYSNNPEACPVNMLEELERCPFDGDCDGITPRDWGKILEKRNTKE